MATTYLKYHIDHSVSSILGVGARCRTCGRIYDQSRNRAVGFCPIHDRGNALEEAELGRLACRMQDYFYNWAVSFRSETDPSFAWPSPLPGSTASEHWWWTTVNVLRLQCEWSLTQLQCWWEDLWGTHDGRYILHVSEIKFCPQEYWHHQHCAFLVVLRSGAEYIIDPTGVQFGPDWPLLCPRREYELWAMHPDPYFRRYRERPVGTASRLLAEGRQWAF
ncbi:hypothetical protein P153DRAFT_301974 [Dothidotthia symphoricarpi CBS 119687]|uniref:Uncharacterized protein n=1 Tax=Dothidotthia symphoricarpi CBS 119687 TaxID=1392245 RepID=A0A6A5ZXV2_9PLEO|nr:uncharacterized protein P153DRAFT_301974 [Dothidotthia symphoricarpi CBS 119687]KAF2124410.1 hypothetical protein P153DRAFT_301974 [Dothidotthia symphoricarpi CBS 119687]